VSVPSGLVLAGVQLGGIRPRPAGAQRPVDHADLAVELLGQVGDELLHRLGDDLFQVVDRPGDRGLVDEQQFGDDLLADVGAEVHDDYFHRLAQGQFPWPASPAVPDEAFSDPGDEFVELIRGESGSSLAWQWSLRGCEDYWSSLLILPLGPLPCRLRHAESADFLNRLLHKPL